MQQLHDTMATIIAQLPRDGELPAADGILPLAAIGLLTATCGYIPPAATIVHVAVRLAQALPPSAERAGVLPGLLELHAHLAGACLLVERAGEPADDADTDQGESAHLDMLLGTLSEAAAALQERDGGGIGSCVAWLSLLHRVAAASWMTAAQLGRVLPLAQKLLRGPALAVATACVATGQGLSAAADTSGQQACGRSLWRCAVLRSPGTDPTDDGCY